MPPTRFPQLALGLLLLSAPTALAGAPGDPTGVWIDADGRGAVEITQCGTGEALCGRVVWVKAAEHGGRCGVQILGQLERSRNGTWGGGWIYSPDYDRKFDVEVKRVGSDKLRVVGWAGLRMFSETHVWRRAPADLGRCGPGETVAATDKPEPAASATHPAEPRAAEVAVASVVADPVDASSAKPLPAEAAPVVVSPERKPTSAVDKTRKTRTERGAKRSGPLAEKAAGRVASAGSRPVETRYFKRTADGTCRVDTPWIRLKFDCRRL